MFGFGMGDIAMGTAMEMNGAIDMADGMMLTEMGMPGLGAMEMGMGAMEMGMGQNLVGMGMMENMYGGYGMGYGMGGMMAMDTALMMGCMGVGCTLACCNPGLYRRGCLGMGCNLACCVPRRRFGNCMGFGCTLPCCTTTTTEVIIVNGNNNRAQYQYPQQQYQNQAQYQYQNGYNNQQQQYQNRPQQYQNPPQQQYQQYQPQNQNNNYRANQQSNTNPQSQQQAYRPNQPQNNQQQNPPRQQVSDQLSQQQQQLRQQAKTPNPEVIVYPQMAEYKQASSNQYNINSSFAPQSLRQYQNCTEFQSSVQSYQQNKQYSNPNIVYRGHLLKRNGFNWTEYPSAILTRQHLIDQPINNMTKLKIKTDPVQQNTCFMKITMNLTDDHFYGCYKNEQCDWFCNIIWAKMAMIGKMSDQRVQFTGIIEGNILRKSQFLGNWEFRHVKIDPNGLRSYQNVNFMPTLHLSSIRELWTRFQYINGGNYLVIKCKTNGTKYEYGIPVNYAFAWIKAFYSLLV